jgi:hypothetical protein
MTFKPLFKLAEIHEYPGSSLMPDYIIPLQTHQGFSFAVINEDISGFTLPENHNLGNFPTYQAAIAAAHEWLHGDE